MTVDGRQTSPGRVLITGCAAGGRRARAERLFRRRRLQPETVARAILRAVDRNLAEVPVGAEVHAIGLLDRIAPALTRQLSRLDLVG